MELATVELEQKVEPDVLCDIVTVDEDLFAIVNIVQVMSVFAIICRIEELGCRERVLYGTARCGCRRKKSWSSAVWQTRDVG